MRRGKETRHMHALASVCALALLLLLAACATGNVVKELAVDNGTIQAYFCPRENCSAILSGAILNHSDVQCAFYDVSSPDVLDAITTRQADIVIDSENYFGLGTKAYAKGIMHDKFCVFERGEVFTGSYNPTAGGNFHRNNILLISSKLLSDNYLREFDELKRNVDQSKKTRTRYQKVLLSGVLVENYFCPEDGCERKVLDAVNRANESIHFMLYSFTADPIGDAIISKRYALEIRGIFEEQQISRHSEYEKMHAAGMDVRVDEQPYLMHSKVFIIDRKTVITGSFNPSQNADQNNDENILIIHSPEIAAQYLEEFERVWQASALKT